MADDLLSGQVTSFRIEQGFGVITLDDGREVKFDASICKMVPEEGAAVQLRVGPARWGGGIKALQVPVTPYVDVHGKCTIGYSDWGSKDPEYRPRKPDTVTDVGSDPADVAKMNQATDSANAAKQYNADLKAAENACNDLCTAKTDLTRAQANQVAVNNDPNSTATDKANAQTAVDVAQGAVNSAQGAYDTAHGKMETSRQAVETATGQSQQDFNCSCP